MMMDKVKRTESSEDTESTTTASRRDSEDSDSGVNLSEREVTHLGTPEIIRQNTVEFDPEDETFVYHSETNKEDVPKENNKEEGDYSSSVPMAGLPLAGAMMGLCLGGPVGVLAGVKLGGVAAVGGSLLGYTGACVIKEQKDMRKHIDDHYKNEPKLYVLTPKEEAVLARRRASLRSQQSTESSSVRQLPNVRNRHQSESQRHLPSVRSRRSCYRSSSSLSEHRGYSSANNSPMMSRRRTDSSSSQRHHHHPPNLQKQQFRRLGDLSIEEQKSVIALIKAGRVEKEYLMTNPSSRPPRSPRSPRRRLPTTDGHNVSNYSPGHSHQVNSFSPAESRRKQFARQHHDRRASSLPDVLEEDCFSNKS